MNSIVYVGRWLWNASIGNFPKTIYFAIKLAQLRLIVSKNVYTNIRISANIQGKGILILGKRWERSRHFPSQLRLGRSARLIINGNFTIYSGCQISLADNAVLSLGSGYINDNVTIDCHKSISIGNKVYISKGVHFRDSDNHKLVGGGNITEPVVIEDNVWIGINVTILKGVRIGTGSVIAAGAVVTKSCPSHSLIGGVPAKVLKSNIEWE
jgi:serine acetyltransferase